MSERLIPSNEHSNGPVHTFFGLTYSNFLVLHRAMLQSMPIEWQAKFVALVEQLDQAFDRVHKPSGFEVTAAKDRYVNELSAAEKALAGVTEQWDEAEENCTYHDKNGNEINGGSHVMVPTHDAVPHYRDRPGIAAMIELANAPAST